MQIVVYKYANHSLFIDKIEERNGEKCFLVFPENIKGNCHFGKQSLPIEDGRCVIDFPLARSMYPLWIEDGERHIEGEGLIYKEGKFHRAVEENFSQAFYEIARLKDATDALMEQVQKLNDTVFHTVIF